MTDEQKRIVADASHNRHKLTDWERKFVLDLESRPSRDLSDKQDAALRKIGRKLSWD